MNEICVKWNEIKAGNRNNKEMKREKRRIGEKETERWRERRKRRGRNMNDCALNGMK